MTNHPYIQPQPADGPTLCAVCGKPAQNECHSPPYHSGKKIENVEDARENLELVVADICVRVAE